ncbi:D-3-phosphoglycerate dehydrogenase [[Actinomadura] parvosata subsp. kistnae]|uniref:Phosphoglycerate dehydrogenase n=1 Tax=[Actinomadura] parvosata subsp. kistnae TaxID=1909395 RepID=A0A1V0AG88_9ACTN|nr:2-hydroxyacid dehydrogenase [Nonomuraea sp. ATCC 55076]AQZ69102.1 phosphoglycerate dehydrogenase [Nonomuraea sp. ATCC 55076]SPL92316.1 D-3-phosphoglycerate dehydrogenase [Actinomadura parvosata subsp. kistnae]
MKTWVPSDSVADVLSELPGVECAVYDGTSSMPDGVEEVEVWIPPLVTVPDVPGTLARMSSLRLLQTVTAGVEPYRPHMPEGAVLCNARGVHEAGTAEWAVGAMIAVLREFPGFVDAQRRGEWTYHHTDVLADSTVLIVGYGSIGAALERRLDGFEVEIVRVARSAREGVHGMDELPALLPQADVVVLLVPATAATAGMVDAAFLARMKDGAVLVNAARGGVVDTDALVAELKDGRLRAALDVTAPEPLPEGHPLWSAPGVLITPHVAGSTPASVRRTLRLVRAQVERYLAGEPLENVITDSY